MIAPGTARVFRILLFVPLGILVPLLAVGMASPGMFRWLFDRDGAPQELGAITCYRSKPIVHVLLFANFLIYTAIIWDGLRHYRLGHWSDSVALALVAAYLFFLLRSTHRVSLDGEGMHRYDLVGREVTIVWPDLSHVEARVPPFGDITRDSATYFRSYSDATIMVSETTFNTDDILRQIRLRHTCPEEPYQRHHWYGR